MNSNSYVTFASFAAKREMLPSAHPDNAANGSADGSQHSSGSQPAVSVRKEASFPQTREIPLASTKEEDHHAPVRGNAPVPRKHNVRHSLAIPEHVSPMTMQLSSSGDDLNAPEPLSEAVKIDCGPLLNLLDLHHVQCLYSKQWQLRDKAFQFIAKWLQSEGLGDSSSFRWAPTPKLVIIIPRSWKLKKIMNSDIRRTLLRFCFTSIVLWQSLRFGADPSA